MCFILINVALASFIVGTITLLVIRRDATASTFRDAATALASWAAANGLSPSLTAAMADHHRLAFSNADLADEKILAGMPTSLRRRALRQLYLSTLRRCYLFSGAGAAARMRFVDAILAASHVELLMPGSDVVSDGDHVAELLICVSGALALTAPSSGASPDDMPLLDGTVHGGRLLGEGDAVAEVAFFTDVPHAGAVRTLTVARLLCIPKARYEAIAADFPLGTRAVLENLRSRAQSVVDAEFGSRGAAAPPGAAHMRASAEGSVGANAHGRGGGLSAAQERALADAIRVRALAASALARADERRTQEFLSAASRGDTSVIRLMLQQGISANSADYDGRTALMLSSAKGHTAVVDELLSADADVNSVDALGGCALMEACKAGQDGLIAKLRAAGAGWHLSTVATAAELCTTVFEMNLPLLALFLAAGARPDAGDYDEVRRGRRGGGDAAQGKERCRAMATADAAPAATEAATARAKPHPAPPSSFPLSAPRSTLRPPRTTWSP